MTTKSPKKGIFYYPIAFIRTTISVSYWIILCLVSCVCCLPWPKNKANMYHIAQFIGPMLKPVYGLNCYVEQESRTLPKTAVYISNHQNTMDIVTLAKAIQPKTVTVGKRALARVPIFGWMYWIAGNILLDRNVASKAMQTVKHIVNKINSEKLSVWLFPEGTRSFGRYEMGEFKVGAFIIAIQTGIPIVPIVVSNLNNYGMGYLNNGAVIIKYLKPIQTTGLNMKQARELATLCQKLFLQEYRKLNHRIETKAIGHNSHYCKFTFQENEQFTDAITYQDLEQLVAKFEQENQNSNQTSSQSQNQQVTNYSKPRVLTSTNNPLEQNSEVSTTNIHKP